MAKAYPINPSFGLILTDSGSIIPMGNAGPLDPSDGKAILQLALAAAVELSYLRAENSRLSAGGAEAPESFLDGLMEDFDSSLDSPGSSNSPAKE